MRPRNQTDRVALYISVMVSAWVSVGLLLMVLLGSVQTSVTSGTREPWTPTVTPGTLYVSRPSKSFQDAYEMWRNKSPDVIAAHDGIDEIQMTWREEQK